MTGNLLLIGWALAMALSTAAHAQSRPPNIVFVLADDLGYGELGSYGQAKIRTPRLDELAAEGMRFTRHYAGNAVCAPSRCVLMTGYHPGHAWVRDNREAKPEGQAPLRPGAVTLPRLLKQAGYVTGAFGKWGLGGPGTTGDPLRQGFDRFYGYNCQRVAHNYYPTYLWDNDRRVPLDNAAFSAHQRLPAEADARDPASYRPFAGREYAPDLIMAAAREFVRDNRDRPFFLFVPTTVPHLALQVPEDSLEEYRGRWPDPPYVGTNGYLPHFTPRAAYAGMVTRLDGEVGALMDLIRELGLERDTVFVFSSDNGPTYNRLGGSDSEFFGSAGPFRGLKGSLYEGGIRVPLIVRWKDHIRAGSTSDRLTGFEDWLPTLLELAGAGKSTPEQIDGISFARTLLGRRQPDRQFLYREFPGYGGQQSTYLGAWKGIRQGLNRLGRGTNDLSGLPMELYHLERDPGEEQDVAAEHPAVVAQLEAVMRREHAISGLFPLPAIDR